MSAPGDLPVAAVVRPPKQAARTVLFVPAATFRRMAVVAVIVALLAYPFYADVSLWLGPGIALSVFALWHGFEASRTVPWVPGIVLSTACLQWVLATWACYNVQTHLPIAAMAVEPDVYFSFAVPATIALALGLYLPLRRDGRQGAKLRYRPPNPPASLATVCDAMVIGGTLLRIFVLPLAPVSVKFAIYLLCLLAFVGACGLMLMRVRGWPWRVLLVLAWMFFYQAADLQFLEVLQWSIVFALILVYRFRPRLRNVMPGVLAGMMIFLSLNAFKLMHRDDLRRETLTTQQRASKSSGLISDLLRQPSLLFSPKNLGAQISRLNEGWVIGRIMAWVPTAEPYAGGETIVDGLRSAFVPRLLDPGKTTVGGAISVPRFTGINLINGTSVGLSVPGELYANFGATPAVICTFFYGLFLGWVFSLFVRRAHQSPIWWAWAPFVLFTPISAEQDFSTVVNQISKAGVVMAVMVLYAPGWRLLRELGRRRRGVRPAPPATEAVPT